MMHGFWLLIGRENKMINYISQERLKSYDSILKIKDRNEQLRAYYWNKALCSAVYPAIQCLEVTLRNALDESIKNNPPLGGLYGAGDWWFYNISQYMGDKKIRRRNRFNSVGSRVRFIWEEEQIEKVRRRLNNKGVPANNFSVMAGLDFGFWTNLFSRNYEDTGSGTLLWPNLLPHVFPNLPSGLTRQDVENRLNIIREFRNRISHHEPIWKFYHYKAGSTEVDYHSPVYGRSLSIRLLARFFDELLECIGWISQDRVDYLKKSGVCSSFRKLCTDNGLKYYIAPKEIPSIPYSRAARERMLIIDKYNNGEIFSVKRKEKVVAVFGIDIPMDY